MGSSLWSGRSSRGLRPWSHSATRVCNLGKRGCGSSAGITFRMGSWARVGTRFISRNFLGQSHTKGSRPRGKGGNWWLIQSYHLSLSPAPSYASRFGSTRRQRSTGAPGFRCRCCSSCEAQRYGHQGHIHTDEKNYTNRTQRRPPPPPCPTSTTLHPLCSPEICAIHPQPPTW